jgi:hypothetical protein
MFSSFINLEVLLIGDREGKSNHTLTGENKMFMYQEERYKKIFITISMGR